MKVWWAPGSPGNSGVLRGRSCPAAVGLCCPLPGASEGWNIGIILCWGIPAWSGLNYPAQSFLTALGALLKDRQLPFAAASDPTHRSGLDPQTGDPQAGEISKQGAPTDLCSVLPGQTNATIMSESAEPGISCTSACRSHNGLHFSRIFFAACECWNYGYSQY